MPHYRWRWMALSALLTAEAMNLLDATIVQVAAPVIHTDLGGAESDIQWFSAAYTLPFALLLITGGRLGDIVGRKRIFLAGVVGFTLASMVCALAPTAAVLIGSRVLQGAAAALVIPQTFGLIRAMFAGAELSRALGAIGPVMGVAAVCGPALGAVLTHADLLGSSWRSVFLVNVPLAAAVLAVGPLLLEDVAADRPRLDLTGTALAMLGLGLITLPLVEGDPTKTWYWAAISCGAAVLVGFGFQQRRRRHSPLVEPSLFADRRFPAALVTSTLFFAVVNGLMLVIVLYLEVGLGQDVLTAGLTLLPWSAGSAVASWVAGTRLVPRFGSRVMFAGLAVLAVGLLGAIAAYRTGDLVASRWPLLSALAVSGVGLGLFTVPFFTIALSRVAAHETGSAAGLLNAVQQLGATLGVAVLGSVFLAGHGDATSAVERSVWVALGLVTAAAVAAAIMCARVRPSVPLGSGGNRRADDTTPARVQEQQDADEPVRGQ